MSDPLWRWEELCEALSLPHRAGPEVCGISIDSRSIEPGELFVALTGDPGPRFQPSKRSARDGHDFIDAAIAKGAAGVLSHDTVTRRSPELKVTDTLDALWDLGRAGRARLDSPVIAITGSSGKTTTKELLAAALGAFRTSGSLNNHLGVPLSLARTPRDADAAVYEIGTNHPGEIAPLVRLVEPHVAVLLNVHPAHRENFASMAELRTEKLSIAAGLVERGVLVVSDDIDDAEVAAHVRRVRFGTSEAAAVRLLEVNGNRATYQFEDQRLEAHVPGGGGHRAMSLAAVLAVHLALGLDPEPACSLTDALIPEGRGSRAEVAGITIIDDSYNANPESMAAALQTLAAGSGRSVALLGEMLELGPESRRYHAELADLCQGLAGVFCVGQGMRALAERLASPLLKGWFAEPDESLIDAVLAAVQPGDTLLIKGSNRVFWARGFVSQLRAALRART